MDVSLASCELVLSLEYTLITLDALGGRILLLHQGHRQLGFGFGLGVLITAPAGTYIVTVVPRGYGGMLPRKILRCLRCNLTHFEASLNSKKGLTVACSTPLKYVQ